MDTETKKKSRRGGARVISEEGKERHAAAMKDFWQRWREERPLRKQLSEVSEKWAQLHRLVAAYDEQPLHQMNEQEARRFAANAALTAQRDLRIADTSCPVCCDDIATTTRPMTEDEVGQYAGAILSSIIFFNKRDEKHREHMRYREECRLAMEQAKELEKTLRISKEKSIVVHVM